jgi:hypothetical protein
MSTCFEADVPIALADIENVDGVSVVHNDNGYFLVAGDVIAIDEVNEEREFTHVTRYGHNDPLPILLSIEKSLGVTFYSEYETKYWENDVKQVFEIEL